MESFWGRLKNDLTNHRYEKTRANTKAAIQEYIEIFYNRQWRHSHLGYITPARFAEEFSRTARAACNQGVYY